MILHLPLSIYTLFLLSSPLPPSFFFFFNDTATTEIYTLSLHDALPICLRRVRRGRRAGVPGRRAHHRLRPGTPADRKSTRLNSSHEWISYAVFCLKKKKTRKSNDRKYNRIILRQNNNGVSTTTYVSYTM